MHFRGTENLQASYHPRPKIPEYSRRVRGGCRGPSAEPRRAGPENRMRRHNQPFTALALPLSATRAGSQASTRHHPSALANLGRCRAPPIPPLAWVDSLRWLPSYEPGATPIGNIRVSPLHVLQLFGGCPGDLYPRMHPGGGRMEANECGVTIAVSRRASIALMDSFIGPKT